jgi:hypothetical protein
MDPIRSVALIPHHTPTVTSYNGTSDQTFSGDFTNLAKILSGFSSVPRVRALRMDFK